MVRKRWGLSIKYHNGNTRKVWFSTSDERDAAYKRYKARCKPVGKGREIFYVKTMQRS